MRLFLLIATFVGLSTNSFAQMNYIATPQRPVAPTKPSLETSATEDTPATRMWLKYKELAGETPKPEPQQEQQNTQTQTSPLQELLKRQQSHKQAQGQMRTLTVK